MKLTLNKHSAVHLMRTLRRQGNGPRAFSQRCDLFAPDCSPHSSWTRGRLKRLLEPYGISFAEGDALSVAVPGKSSRLQVKGVSNTICGATVPPGSFVFVNDELAISGPELLFVEMAGSMTEAEHLMFGHEICGSFARDPDDPINGEAVMGLEPLTSVRRIREFIAGTRKLHGRERAIETLRLLSDGAWSPGESVVAAMASLPVVELGYDLGPLVLNERVDTPELFAEMVEKESRVPDILFGDTGVGINYDGGGHLDLDSIVRASLRAAYSPDDPFSGPMIRRAVAGVRAKYVDDIRRNRELSADGLLVLPVVKEDLYEPGGLDLVMFQIMSCIELRTGRDFARRRKELLSDMVRGRRQRLLMSLLPGSEGLVPDAVTVFGDGGNRYAVTEI